MSSSTAETYVVAAVKPWNLKQFAERAPVWPGTWRLVEVPDALTYEMLKEIGPRYVFFPHWSWKVPEDITRDFECVCFHMTDVPYGRGGSPLQNLIARGHKDTVISALRMTKDLDAGPVYLKTALSLEGSAQEIFERASCVAFDMMAQIAATEMIPAPQSGTPVIFKRRNPSESTLPDNGSLESIYDHIRMLDADTYPRAFLDHGEFRLEFSQAAKDGEVVMATVQITPNRPVKS